MPSICLLYGFGVALGGLQSFVPYWGAHQMRELCSLCKPFIFRVFGVFRGLPRRSWSEATADQITGGRREGSHVGESECRVRMLKSGIMFQP